MLTTIIVFLPLVACLFWMTVHVALASRTNSFWSLFALMTACALALTTSCTYYAPEADYTLLTRASNFSQLVVPCVIPLLLIYLRRLRTGKSTRPVQLLWIFAPIVLFTAAELLTALAGREAVEAFIEQLYTGGNIATYAQSSDELRLYYIFAVVLFRVVMGIQLLWLIVSVLHIRRANGYRYLRDTYAFVKGARIDVLELQVLNSIIVLVLFSTMMFVFRDDLAENLALVVSIPLLMTIVISQFCLSALYGSKKHINLGDIRYSFLYNYRIENKDKVVGEMISRLVEDSPEVVVDRVQTHIGRELVNHSTLVQEEAVEQLMARSLLPDTTRIKDEDSLIGRFAHLMDEEKLFLQAGLTLGDIADRLRANKTYISKMVKSHYNMSFPDVINTLRIDYAEEYLIRNPNAKQNDIAEASGFTSASSLNNIFKKITGVTPRIWLATYEQQNRGE